MGMDYVLGLGGFYCLVDSVGLGGINRPDDVETVQKLLQLKGYYRDSCGPCRIDRSCGIFTVQAIKQFQAKYVTLKPDGLITPGAMAWKKLIEPNPLARVGHPSSPVDTRLAPVYPLATVALPAGIRWPLERNIIRRGLESNTFGEVRGPGRVHQGWDFQANVGTPCYAIGKGKVVHVVKNIDDNKYIDDSFGNIVVIELDTSPLPDHPKLYAAYAHLKSGSISVNVGDKVEAGRVIGEAGVSGNARYKNAWKGPNGVVPKDEQHLHFEIRTKMPPGKKLEGRISPMKIFGSPPKKSPVTDPIN
jgi:murein DD-endopeptidase MepM/ murein hydrolase activator NlpD